MRVCSRPGCPRLTTSGRCPECRSDAEAARGTAAQRGYDSRWRRTREAYLEQHPFCERTGCLVPATDVNHVDGLGPHGPRGHDWSNLESLCHPHHSQHTAREQPGGWNA